MDRQQLEQRIEELEEELSNTKSNKRTEAAIGKLKAKIASLREELEKKSSGGKKGEGFAVKKEGDATVGLVGKPSVGKSTLISSITNQESKIGHYEFTTLDVVPGLLNYKEVDLQVLDLPGIIENAADNRGFGKKVLSVVRVCDLVVLVVNAKKLKEIDMLLTELEKSGIRLNKKRPNIQVIRKPKGGIEIPINHSHETLSNDMIRDMLNENKIVNAEVLVHEDGITPDDLIDAVYENIVYAKGMICLNKIDLCSKQELQEKRDWLKKVYPDFPVYGISAEKDVNIDGFKEFVWRELGFIWVYMKEPRKEPDYENPLVLQQGSTIEDLCKKIHKDFLKKFRYARIKGNSAKFKWQKVGIKHVLHDEDVVEISTR